MRRHIHLRGNLQLLNILSNDNSHKKEQANRQFYAATNYQEVARTYFKTSLLTIFLYSIMLFIFIALFCCFALFVYFYNFVVWFIC